MNAFPQSLVQHIAQLASIPVSEAESKELAQAFSETLEVISNLEEQDVTRVEPTHQVTGLINSWREDEIDQERMFTQKQALANAAQTHQGYVVISQVISKQPCSIN